MKQNIQKLNLCSKMDMSKTVWINVCLPVGYMWNENSNHPNFHHTCWHTELVRHTELVARCSAAKKGRSTVNYRQSLAFDRPYLSCNDHCDRWLFQEIYFCYFQKQLCTQMFFKTRVVRNIAIFTGKHLCWSLFLMKLQVLQPATLF